MSRAGHARRWLTGGFGTRAALGAVLLVVALVTALFLPQRYDIKYVYDYSSKDLETPLPHRRDLGRSARLVRDLGALGADWPRSC